VGVRTKQVMPRRGSKCISFTRPVSTTNTTSGTVMDVSAMLVASTILRTPAGGTWKWGFSRVLNIQKGFQYGPYNSTGVSKGCSKCTLKMRRWSAWDTLECSGSSQLVPCGGGSRGVAMVAYSDEKKLRIV
jgi:hypothetical protein